MFLFIDARRAGRGQDVTSGAPGIFALVRQFGRPAGDKPSACAFFAGQRIDNGMGQTCRGQKVSVPSNEISCPVSTTRLSPNRHSPIGQDGFQSACNGQQRQHPPALFQIGRDFVQFLRRHFSLARSGRDDEQLAIRGNVIGALQGKLSQSQSISFFRMAASLE